MIQIHTNILIFNFTFFNVSFIFSGWHNRLNNAAKYGSVPFCILVPDLQQDADVVEYSVRAYDLERDIQRKSDTILEKKIQTAWDKYMNGDITTSHFFKMVKEESMLCWTNVNWMIVVKSGKESCEWKFAEIWV